MPLMYDREDPSTAELLALQGQLKGLQGLNKAVMEPYSYGQFGNPYMVPPLAAASTPDNPSPLTIQCPLQCEAHLHSPLCFSVAPPHQAGFWPSHPCLDPIPSPGATSGAPIRLC